MMDTANVDLLREGLAGFGVNVSADGLRAIVRHLEMVADWNERVNLTAITAPREMVVKHAIDCAALYQVVVPKAGATVLDVGTGAGFPGVTLKCLQPSLRVALLESLNKRCKFLEAVGQELFGAAGADSGYDVIWGRAEDMGKDQRYRERYDLVTARAVAELRILAEYCLPFCRVGGDFVAMKGPAAEEEVASAEKAISILGGAVEEVRSIELPENAGSRTLIRVKKVKATPKLYPRRAGTPAKSPL